MIQRFGGALNLNLHIHALVLDGVFARHRAGALIFHPTRRLTALDVAEVLATVERGLKRLLDRRGLGDGDDDGSASDAWADEAPVLAGLAAVVVADADIVLSGRRFASRLLSHYSGFARVLPEWKLDTALRILTPAANPQGRRGISCQTSHATLGP